MTKVVDYSGASKRHYSDATLLQGNRCDSNAGHLFGISAECGIKALLVGLGYPTQPNGDMVFSHTPDLRGHIDHLHRIFNQLLTFINGRSGGKYLSMVPNAGNFSDWRVDHRYYADTAIPASLSKWESAAREVQSMIQSAQLDGVVK